MDLQTPEPEFGCRTPDSQTPEPESGSRTPDSASVFRTSTHPFWQIAPWPDSGPCILYSAMAALNAIVCEALLAEAFQHLPTSARSASATPHVVEAAAVRELQAAHAALGTVREEAATVGRQLLPLRSAAELATLLQAELLYPPGTPKRSNKVLVELRTHGVAMPSEFELDLLLSRLHAHDDWNRALRSMTVPSEQRCVLVPPVTECVIRVVGVVRVALPKVVRPRSPAGLLRAHALALLLGAAHSERRQLRGSQRLVPHVGLPDHVSTESSV